MNTYIQASNQSPNQASWRVHLVYNGMNANNQSEWSNKFWEVVHTAGNSTSTVRWGKVGTAGQTMSCHYTKALDKAREKMAKGYSEVPSKCFVRALSATTPSVSVSRDGARLLAKLKSMAFPYNLVEKVVAFGESIQCLDENGEEVMTLTLKGAKDLLGA